MLSHDPRDIVMIILGDWLSLSCTVLRVCDGISGACNLADDDTDTLVHGAIRVITLIKLTYIFVFFHWWHALELLQAASKVKSSDITTGLPIGELCFIPDRRYRTEVVLLQATRRFNNVLVRIIGLQTRLVLFQLGGWSLLILELRRLPGSVIAQYRWTVFYIEFGSSCDWEVRLKHRYCANRVPLIVPIGRAAIKSRTCCYLLKRNCL